MKVTMNHYVAQDMLAAHIRTKLLGVPFDVEVEIVPPAEAPAPVTPILCNLEILDEIANAHPGEKISLIKKLRDVARDAGVSLGLAFAKRLVELAPQFRSEYSAYPPVKSQTPQ